MVHSPVHSRVHFRGVRIASWLAPLVLMSPLLAHCGGSTQATPADGGASEATIACQGPVVDAPHRPTAPTCKATPLYGSGDAASACNSDADCASSIGRYCRGGACTLDQCSQDADCAQGTACICSDSYYGGNGRHGNSCMPATCAIDSDCGPGGLCSPHIAQFCGAITGLSCHSPEDACTSDADCCATPDTPACKFDPTAAHWKCLARTVCNG